jgi:nitrogen regulatory protein P-II 1
MKKIEAIVKNAELSDVRYALREIGVRTIRVTELAEELVPVYDHGAGRQIEEVAETRTRSKISVVVPDDEADGVVLALVSTLKDGGIGDGNSFVSSIEYVVRLEAPGFFFDVF